MTKDLVKHNINFLEYPLWFQDDRFAETHPDGYVWKDLEGYEYRSGYKVPVKTDAIFLLYLMLQCQRNNYTQELRLTRYQVVRDCGLLVDSKWYDRLEDSLKRWKSVNIFFQGIFYDGKTYHAINYGILDYWSVDEKTKELKITFASSFIQMMLGKGFFKFINFSEFKQLRSSLATRLYEILIKSYQGRDEWPIEAGLLAQKIPMRERYPAHIIPKIQTAIERINKSTNLCFDFSTRRSKKDHKKTILVFRQVSPAVIPVQALTPEKKPAFVLPQLDDLKALVALLPEARREHQTILEMIVRAYEKHGLAYVARNIRYTNRHAKRNYRPYLIKALHEDYGLAMQEDEEIRRQAEAEQAVKVGVEKEKQAEADRRRKLEKERRKLEEEVNARAKVYMETLDEEQRKELDRQAIASLEPTMQRLILEKRLGWRIMHNLALLKTAVLWLEEETKKENAQIPAESAEALI